MKASTMRVGGWLRAGIAAGLLGSLTMPGTASSAPISFDITSTSFIIGTGYGIDGGQRNDNNEVSSANPTLLDVTFSTSGFSAQNFSLDLPTPSTKTFLFGTVDFEEPNAGGGILSTETDNLDVKANFLFASPTGVTQTLTATATVVTGSVSDAASDYALSWQPLLVNFGNGGQFQINLSDLNFTGTGSKDLMATITLLSAPVEGRLGPDATVPEPGTLGLLVAGLGGIGFLRRRRAVPC